jgi:hypothetical protein
VEVTSVPYTANFGNMKYGCSVNTGRNIEKENDVYEEVYLCPILLLVDMCCQMKMFYLFDHAS